MNPKRIVLAHGLWMPGVEMLPMKLLLEKEHGIVGELFSYPSLQDSLDANAARFAAFVGERAGDVDGIVAHSLGGIVALKALALNEALDVPRLVCLGSPLTGSRVAERLGSTELGRRVVGKSLGEHVDRGGIDSWDSNIEVGIIAGTRSFGIGRLVESPPGDSDGTVALEETRLPGATAHISLPVTHTQLLFDSTVARQTIHFLRHGRFV